MKTIGTAEFKNFDALICWFNSLTPEMGRQFVDAVKQKVDEMYPEFVRSSRRDTDAYYIKAVAQDMYKVDKPSLYRISESTQAAWEERDWATKSETTTKKLVRFYQFKTEFEQLVNVGIWNEVFAYLYFGNPVKGIVVPTPEKFFDFTSARDWSDTSLPQVRALLGVDEDVAQNNSWLPAAMERDITPNSLAELKKRQEAAMAELDEKERQIKNCETKDLAELKKQVDQLMATIESKKQSLMLDLEEKRDEMSDKMNQLKAQIFMLDSQIYAIQCFAGEAIKFSHVRKGANAPMTEPVVIYQKLRFLDEDLGRMVSMYQLDWSEIGLFEDFLRYSPEALETFAPDKRCISLVRLSKTNTQIGMSSKYPYSNLLENYEYYHGRTVGIIIRNGENLYLGWTDEDRVCIQDDFIISHMATDIKPAEQRHTYGDKLMEHRAQRQEREKEYAERMDVLNGIVSRAFVFNILQGIVKNTSWLPLPAGESLTKPSIYVRYSLADRCLEDHRCSDFDKLIQLANKDVAEGDPLLMMQYLRAHSDNYSNNDRGRGYADRTHDVAAQDCVIYKANLVEYDKPEHMIRYKIPSPFSRSDEDKWIVNITHEGATLDNEAIILERFDRIDRHVFISLEKDYSEKARANFELYEDEYINLAFMNSVWLTWAINTKNLGNWHVKGTPIIYAHAIRYLNTALDYIRKREEAEKAVIDKVDPEICKDPEWPLLLSDWKFMLAQDKEKRTVREITPFQAKRFVKWVKDEMPGRKNFSKQETKDPE